jgi:hypothetical protein
MAAYFFQSPLDIDVKLEGEEARKQVEIKGEKERVSSCPVYYDGESVGGAVCLTVLIFRPVQCDAKDPVFYYIGGDQSPRWKEIDS